MKTNDRWILTMALIWCVVAMITVKLIEWSIK